MKTETRQREEQLVEILHEIAAAGVADNVDPWPDIRARVKSVRRRSRRAALMPRTRLGWALGVLAAALALSTMVYAVGPFIGRVFRIVPSWQYLEEKQLFQDIDLSQTVDGVTVTLRKVYADANQILVGYSVTGLPDPPFHIEAALTDEKGALLRELHSAGVTGSSDLLQVTLPEGDGSYVVAFDGSAIKGTPASLHLHLTMRLARWVPVTPKAEATVVDGQPLEPPAAVQASVPVMYDNGSAVGPFAFDFAVAFLPAWVAEVQETTHASGVAVRLERVVVTPSETRTTLCFEPPAGGGDVTDWTAIGNLHTGFGHNYELTYETRDRYVLADGDICHVLGLMAPLGDQRGKWTLKVTELVGFELIEPYGERRVAGPWVFRFRVP